MRLWPRSLYARLVLVLLAGLIVAQLISAAISLSERDQALFRFSDSQWAQRDAQVVNLMDSLPPVDRKRIALIITTPRLLVSMGDPPPATSPPDPQTEEFQGMLKTLLGPDHEVRVVMAERTPEQAAAGVQVVELDVPHTRPSEHVITEVQLKDGSWVNFDHPRPWSVTDRPYRLLLSFTVLLCSVLLLSFFAVRRMTRPLTDLARAADELGRDIHRPPLPERGPTEVRRAATAFNNMQSRIRDFIDERTRFLTAVSHDLRTPITRLRLRAEMLEDEQVRGKFVRDLQDMENLVNSTMDFLRGLETQEAAQPVDMLALLESVQADAAETGQDVSLPDPPELKPIVGRPRALRRCLENLVSNAVRYGGAARLGAEDTGAAVIIRVRDHGPGIPAAELERVFEPYYRLEYARSQEGGGIGLGLSIARNIALLHGGSLVLQNHPEGGLEAVLTLPRS